MTITSTTNQISYTGDGVSLAFAYPSPFITAADIKVSVAGALITTGFTVTGTTDVTGNGAFVSGTVTFASAPANGVAIFIYCDPDLLQSSVLLPNDPLPAKTVEKMVDKVTLQTQRIKQSIGQGLRVPDAAGIGALPIAALRANTIQGYDPLGAPTPVSLAVVPQRLLQREQQTVVAGQTLITFAVITFSMGIGSLVASARGGELVLGVDYNETSPTSITLTSAPTRPIQLSFIAGAPVSNTVVSDATLVAVTPTGAAATNVQAWIRGESTVAPSVRGYWLDQGAGANIHRLRDRVFIGDGVLSSGNLNAPFGGSQLTTAIGNWFEKNAQLVVESTLGKIGVLGVSCLLTGMTSGTAMGVAGVAQASLAGGTVRALYGDATLEAGATAAYGLEIATANRGTNTVANPYSAPAGAYGLKIAQGSAIGYLLGDASSAAPDSSSPGTAAMIVQAGAGATSVHQYNTGLIFYSNALVGNDGTTGTSEAIALGKGMALNWYASSAILGGMFRCDTTAVAGHDVGVILSNDTISLVATASASSVPMLQLTRDTVSAGGVNYLTLSNARTGTNPTWQASGSDANIGEVRKTKGSGNHDLFTNGGLALRVNGSVVVPVNFVQVSGALTGSPASVAAKGSDTDVDLLLSTQGAGLLKTGYASTVAGTPANFTADRILTFKDSSGTTYRIPCRAAAW